jgi:hypothetical protein
MELKKDNRLSAVVGTGSTKANTAKTATSVHSLLVFIPAVWQIEALPILVQEFYVAMLHRQKKRGWPSFLILFSKVGSTTLQNENISV